VIETVSAPWDPARFFYLEIVGETSPVVAENFALVLPENATGDDASPTLAGKYPVYEYWWTLGHPKEWHGEYPEDVEQILKGLRDYDAACVTLLFPTDGNWRVKELTASLRYLQPHKEQEDLWNQAAKEWQQLQPMIDTAASVTEAAVPLVGGAAKGASAIIGAIAKARVQSIPSSGDYPWYVEKTAGPDTEEMMMQGIRWVLPRSVLESFGGRLTGSVSVAFLPSYRQKVGEVKDITEPRDYQKKAIRGHATVGDVSNPPGPDEYRPGWLELLIQPLEPQEPQRTPEAPTSPGGALTA